MLSSTALIGAVLGAIVGFLGTALSQGNQTIHVVIGTAIAAVIGLLVGEVVHRHGGRAHT